MLLINSLHVTEIKLSHQIGYKSLLSGHCSHIANSKTVELSAIRLLQICGIVDFLLPLPLYLWQHQYYNCPMLGLKTLGSPYLYCYHPLFWLQSPSQYQYLVYYHHSNFLLSSQRFCYLLCWRVFIRSEFVWKRKWNQKTLRANFAIGINLNISLG